MNFERSGGSGESGHGVGGVAGCGRGGWGWVKGVGLAVACGLGLLTAARGGAVEGRKFDGAFFGGRGDVEDLRLLDVARRMFSPDPEYQNLAMLYTPQWNGMVEGPTWGAWWVQNSYGTTYCALPFLEEPFVTFLQNSQDLWFNRMGDGRTSYTWSGQEPWVPPDGCLMDAASDTWAIHRQGDGRVAIHDWGIEFTAAGGVLQSELLLIARDRAAVAHYLPKLERCAAFVESRRDPATDLFLAGPAGNLLAPSYAGYRKPDGSYGMGYLTGLSVTYIAFLDRLVELEKLMGRGAEAAVWEGRRERARQGLRGVTTGEGYLIKSLDPDGTRHGVYGAARHGYFESSPNHDAICFRVVDEVQSRRIYEFMAGIPGLRPHGLIVANCPSLDDMYEEPRGLWGFGTWVNGGHWTTCEARMMMAYHRVGAFADARRSMEQILSYARRFRLDNPLVEFGGAVYQPKEPINITYDAFGAPAGFVRGLFEYLYGADALTLVPHPPVGVERLEQRFPVRYGNKRLYLAVSGHGKVEEVWLNGERWADFDGERVRLPYDRLPERAAVEMVMTGGRRGGWGVPRPERFRPGREVLAGEELGRRVKELGSGGQAGWASDLGRLGSRVGQVAVFARRMGAVGLGTTYEAAHARLVVGCFEAAERRAAGLRAGRLPGLEGESAVAADRLYVETVSRLLEGLEREVWRHRGSEAGERRRMVELWDETVR